MEAETDYAGEWICGNGRDEVIADFADLLNRSRNWKQASIVVELL